MWLGSTTMHKQNTSILWRSNLLAEVLVSALPFSWLPKRLAQAIIKLPPSSTENRPWFLHGLLHLTPPHWIHTRRSWYPVNEFVTELPIQPFLNHETIVTQEWSRCNWIYPYEIKQSYRGHHYVLRKMLTMKAVWVIFYTMGHSWQPAPSIITCMANACRGRHKLTAETLSPRSVNQSRSIIC